MARAGWKRSRSDLSSDGAEEDGQAGLTGEAHAEDEDGAMPAPELPPQLGSLHQRRATTSPQKFNSGRFEPLPLQKTSTARAERGEPAKKKVRVQNTVEIGYDSTGTPIITSSSSRSSLPSAQRLKLDTSNISISSGPTTSSNQTPQSAFLEPAQPLNSQIVTGTSASKPPFNLLPALCSDNDILLNFVSCLPITSLISLYAISKTFHYFFNRHPTAFILASMRSWAPNADSIYPWRCYRSLCLKDPVKRQKTRFEGKEAEMKKKWDDLRDCPSLKWLQMVVWREGVCQDMLIQLRVKGLWCPVGTLDAVKRMWFILDLPLNSHRIALIHDTSYISNETLENLTHFLMKVDMRFTEPEQQPYPIRPHPNPALRFRDNIAGGLPSGVPMRKILLAERQLTPLWRVIRGWSPEVEQPQIPTTRLDVLKLWIRHRYQHPPDTPDYILKQDVLGIPWYEVGTAGFERTGVGYQNVSGTNVPVQHPAISGAGLSRQQQRQLIYPHQRRLVLVHEKPRERLLTPDQLIIRESMRRQLEMHKRYVRIMLWGFMDAMGKLRRPWTEKELLRVIRNG